MKKLINVSLSKIKLSDLSTIKTEAMIIGTYESKKLDTVKNAFGVSSQRAKEYLELLNDKQYRDLKDSMKIGGKNNG